ncbi:EAL domain-containing protein [Thalassotalea euphylliae]|uniref:EAL domain-containing protein n=1 Tax=Thalassotalea euphylliae TaxID=1655234 RepID=A0A3E0ULU8_9GAMM|nr:EAL domain-containing protein [Thalassotalea euphylliae]REL36692.1 EAL domain-containing protein [Thalassotalea euphylliae]
MSEAAVPHIFQHTLKAVIKRFELGALLLYLASVAFALGAIWFEQNQQAEAIMQATNQWYPASLVEIFNIESGLPLYHEQLSSSDFTLLREVSNDTLTLVFIHPVYLLVSSWLFIAFNIVFVAFVLAIRGSLSKTLTLSFDPIRALENWVALSRIHGKYQPIQAKEPISESIAELLQKLQEAKASQGQAELQIRERLLLEPETGVGNREFFNNRLDALLKEEDSRGCVMLVCFKDFDTVQAAYGAQQALDIVEQAIGLIQKRLVNFNNYFIARPNEAELALLLPGFYADEAEKLANRVLASISQVPLPIGVAQEEFVHMGVVCFAGENQAYKVMAEADMALRNAQLQGPSQWFMYDTGEVAAETAKGSLKWRTFLERAIEKNAFVIFFQPVIASQSDQILHHEVLSKVRDSQGQLTSARVFLPMAQKCGLSAKIDLLVFEQVCRLLQYESKQPDACSLNLSIDALLDEQFIEAMFIKLAQVPDIANRLIIEISEYHLVTHLNKLAPVVGLLDELGVKILADKVGQYVVSTDYLRDCPISYIKLHRSIVYLVHEKMENQVFIQSLKARCLQYGVKIYALGVESKEEWRTLVHLGVTGGQGHFFTEPVAQMANAIVLP